MRWLHLWHGLFYTSLIAVAGATLWLDSPAWGDPALLFVQTLLLGLWYGVCIVTRFEYWRSHPLLTYGYYAVGWGLWFALAERHSLCWFLLCSLSVQVNMLSSRFWKFPGIAILTALSIWALVTGSNIDVGTLLIFVSIIFIGLLTAFQLDGMYRQNREKDRLLRELETTRQELAEASRWAGIVQERQRLAYEIHDTLAQGFASIIMHVGAAKGTLPTDVDAAQRHFDQISRTARENLVEARRLLWALQPEALERDSLSEVLSHLTRKWSEESGIAVHASITGAANTLRPEIEVTILRAAQEALANVRKHAKAGQVMMTLSYMDDMVALDVHDDGAGFDPEQAPASFDEHTSGGFGLKALRERVKQLGGTCAIESAPAEGTTLAVALPALPFPGQPQGIAPTMDDRANHAGSW